MKPYVPTIVLAILAAQVLADAPLSIPMNIADADGVGASIGHVQVADSPYGVVLTPDLAGLLPGVHGFHVHENPSCAPAMKDGVPVPALSAGGHLDPRKTGRHSFAWGDGHLGDLPPLYVDAAGRATHPILAPRLKMGDLTGRALVIHAGGDNHSDHPSPLGGGGARVACGVAK